MQTEVVQHGTADTNAFKNRFRNMEIEEEFELELPLTPHGQLAAQREGISTDDLIYKLV